MTQKEKDIKRLIKHIAKEDVVPFLGSGFSLKAGAPSVWNLKEAIVKDIDDEDFMAEIGNLNKISLAELSEKHIIYNGGSRNALLSLLKRLFELQPTDLSDHNYLRKIPHFSSLYTTNYETFIETAYPVSELLVVNSNESYTFVGSKQITLYKIHGDLSTLSSPDSVVISTTDYNEYFRGKKFEHLWTQFKTDAGKRTLLFIGYSLEDSNILNIIKNVRNLSGGSAKEWFLVAPGLNSTKINQLKKLRVTYIDAKAEEILPQILESLKDTVDNDYKHKLVRTETYSRFCEINGQFRPQTIVGSSENKVVQYNPIDGAVSHHQLQMQINERVDLNNPAAYNSVMPFPFGDTSIKIPAICVTNSQMNSFTHRYNGISMAHKDDISNLFIGPVTDSLKWTLRQRSIHFKEKVKGCRYKLGEYIHIKLQTPLYIIHMYECAPSEWRIEFDFNDNVTSTRDALRWIEFLIVSSQERTLEMGDVKITTKDNLNNLIIELSKVKTYFEILQELEQDYDIEFENIECYSEQNLTKAVMVLSYYSKSAIRHAIDTNGHYIFHVDETRLNGTIPIMKEAELMMTRNDKLADLVLCGNTFSFKYLITIYNDVSLVKCEQQIDNKHLYLTEFKASTDTEDILVIDKLPDFYREGVDAREEDGIALYYKSGEREKYGVPAPVMKATLPPASSTS